MRHLLTAILAVILLSVAFMVFANNRCGSEKDSQTDSLCLAESVSDEQSRYYGDTLYQFDGKTVIYDYSSGDDVPTLFF